VSSFRARLRFVIDREARLRKLWVPIVSLVLAVIWAAQAVDDLLGDGPGWLHGLAILTLVLVVPFAAFWVAVLWRRRHRFGDT
jgi:hypothetical protein